jgi:hypothetical protein
MMREYNTFEDIEKDLEIFSLKRKIALEELKFVQGKVEEDLKPIRLMMGLLKLVGKFGLFKLLKKIIR